MGGIDDPWNCVVFLSSFFCFFPVYRDIAVDGTLLSTIEGVVKKKKKIFDSFSHYSHLSRTIRVSPLFSFK